VKLIIGLGNPGKTYEKTRHNVGFDFIKKYVKTKGGALKKVKEFNSEIVKIQNNLFICPLTYMNNSGEAVLKLVNYYKINLDDILVIYDDLDLPFGTFKIKPRGSSGGHKGMSSVITLLNSEAIKRVRVGISKVDKEEVIDYVLSRFSKEELKTIDKIYVTLTEIIDDFLIDEFDIVMNKYN